MKNFYCAGVRATVGLCACAGPVPLAAAATRLVVLGSAESLSTAVLSGGASAADLWLVRAIRFLADQPVPHVAVADRPLDQVRLVMTSGERSAVIALSTAGIPLAWILIGGAILVWRRKRTA